MNKVEKSCSTPLNWDWKSTPWYSTRISRVDHQLMWLMIIDDDQQDIHQVKHHHNNNLIIILIFLWNNLFFHKNQNLNSKSDQNWKNDFSLTQNKTHSFFQTQTEMKHSWWLWWRHRSIFRKPQLLSNHKIKIFSSNIKQNSFSWWCWRRQSIFRFSSKWKFYCFLHNFFEASKNKSDDVIDLFLENVIKLTTNQFWAIWGIVPKIENYTPSFPQQQDKPQQWNILQNIYHQSNKMEMKFKF